jgi:tetratricopeptide (TPR) repeat protein
LRIEFIILAFLVLIPLGIASSDYLNESVTLDNVTENATVANESNFIGLYNEGCILLVHGEYTEAIQFFDRAIEIKPQDELVWYQKGEALQKLGRYDESIASYDRFIEQNPQDEFVWYQKGLVLKALGRDSEAKAAFDKATLRLPTWIEFITFSRGEGFDALLILYNEEDQDITCDGTLRVELYDDRDYKNRVWSKSFDVAREDFESYTWGFGNKAQAWHLKRMAFDDIKPGMEYPVYLYIRAYFDTPDGRTLKDTTMV